MSEKIKPALTAEEWGDARMSSQYFAVRVGAGLVARKVVANVGEIAPLNPSDLEVEFDQKDGPVSRMVSRPFALAALALYGQPFGFTREDVKILRECAYAAGTFGATDISEEEGQVLTSIADRIEALLPEKEGA